MPSTDDTFITLLLDQPAIYWSLVAAGSILLLAILLWAAMNIRGRLQQRKMRQAESARAAAAARSVTTAPRDLPPGLAELIEEDKDETPKTAAAVVTGDQSAVAMASGDGGDGTPGVREMNGIPDTDVVTDEAAPPAVLEDESELMALFETDVIIDPHVQAMRDNLPEIGMQELLSQLQSVSRQLQERNAAAQP